MRRKAIILVMTISMLFVLSSCQKNEEELIGYDAVMEVYDGARY